MEAERSIFLQKKMILFLSLIIGVLTGVIYVREFKVDNTIMCKNDINLITVNVSEDENEILRKNVKYLSTKIIVEEPIVNNIINEKIEFLAGDVTSSIGLEDIANEVEKNEIVADDSKSITEVTSEYAALEIIEAVSEELIVEETSSNEEIVQETLKNEEIIEENSNSNEGEIEETSNEVTISKVVKYRELAENNPPTEYEKVIEASATAYCLCKKCCGKSPDHPAYGYTCSGIKIEQGTGIKVIAVDPSYIPLKSKVYVEGLNGAWDYGYAIAADTGSAIKELKIDLYMDTHEEALQWGRKKVNVYILGE